MFEEAERYTVPPEEAGSYIVDFATSSDVCSRADDLIKMASSLRGSGGVKGKIFPFI